MNVLESWMNIYPAELLQQLDFHIIREELAANCEGAVARQMALDLHPSADAVRIRTHLLETSEGLQLLSDQDGNAAHRYVDCMESIQRLGFENAVLTMAQIHQLRSMLRSIKSWKIFFKERTGIYPVLSAYFNPLHLPDSLLEQIDKQLDEHGLLRDDASDLLKDIRKRQHKCRLSSDHVYREQIRKLKQAQQLSDIEENFLNGRRVLGVWAEYKRDVRGNIHGVSTQGRIVFIEPQEAIEWNNMYVEMQREEMRETERILRALTALCFPYLNLLQQSFELLNRMDFVQARAKLATRMEATMPVVHAHGHSIHIIEGYHPVLFLQQKKSGETTVPFDVRFDATHRILIISGPNAGGKSIVLKAMGLFQLMMQSGLLVPVAAQSEMRICQGLFADIGDQQSIEEGLSTYSSRLLKMKYMLQNADQHAFFLLDELGSGSDPELGAALAEVWLKRLNQANASGVVTTHFHNLKMLAQHELGLFSASMLYDVRQLRPLYRLQVGEPGPSFTFEVAGRMGLPPDLLEEAKALVQEERIRLEALLTQLQKEKNKILRQQKDLQKQISKAAAEKRSFQELYEKHTEQFFEENRNREAKQRWLDLGRKLESFLQEWQQIGQRKEVIQKIIRYLDYEEHARVFLANLEKSERYKTSKISRMKARLDVGSRVRILNSHEAGVILKIQGDRAQIRIGNIVMDVGLERVEEVRFRS